MQKSQSDPAVLRTRKEIFGRTEQHIGNAIPGYLGHVPGRRHEDQTYACTFARSVEAARGARSRSTFDHQQLQRGREKEGHRSRTATATITAPAVDNRGIQYPAAGDYFHSRIRASHEEKDPSHFHSSMGLTSKSHENLGAAEQLRGYGRCVRGIPGYGGYVPGKHAENVHADTWSKTSDKALAKHFDARVKAPKSLGVLAENGTLVASVPADRLPEMPIFNPSYQDRVRGWSSCQFTGSMVDPAGRMAPRDRQEAYDCLAPAAPNICGHGRRGAAIHGYAGWVPGRVGENIVGERQCKTNAISDHMYEKARFRITAR